MNSRVPLSIVPTKTSLALARYLRYLSANVAFLVPGLEFDLKQAEMTYDVEDYVGIALVNSIAMGIMFTLLLFTLQMIQQADNVVLYSLGYGFLLFALFLYLFVRYPKIIAGKLAEQVDKNLIFAIKDLRLQIRSGVILYHSLVNVANAGYGEASKEFRKVASKVNTGIPISKALEEMAIRSKSVFVRKMTWQLINTLKAGASLEAALRTLIKDLTLDRRNKIKSYSAELNLWILGYMMFAVVIPTIGSTLLIVLASFGGFEVTPQFFLFFISVTVLMQIMLIGFIKTRRPVVHT
jgi:archaeal flagellar protein FlaJ